MSDQAASTGDSTRPKARIAELLSRRWARAALYALGLALLAGAILMVARDRETIGRAMAHAARAPWWMFAFLLIAPLFNLLLTAAAFTLLTRRYGAIGFGEMLALIGASWLLNYVPFRPGLVARVAYLKSVRGIAIGDSIKVGIQAVAFTLTSAAIVGGVAFIGRAGADPTGIISRVLFAVIFGSACLAFLLLRPGPGSGGRWMACGAVLAIRLADMLLLALRLWVAFQVIGAPVTTPDALFLTGPAQVVGLFPVQLGAVEWTIGLLAAQTHDGVTAALLNRAADMLVAVPVGISAFLWLWSRRRAMGAANLSAGRPQPATDSDK